MSAAVHPDPAVHPGLLEEISEELRSAGVVPRPMNVFHRALERALPEDLAVVIFRAAERRQKEARSS